MTWLIRLLFGARSMQAIEAEGTPTAEEKIAALRAFLAEIAEHRA